MRAQLYITRSDSAPELIAIFATLLTISRVAFVFSYALNINRYPIGLQALTAGVESVVEGGAR